MQNRKVLISLIIPCKNSELNIKKTLSSLETQNSTFEVIFVYTESSDKTLSILDKTLSEDEYILEKESLPGTETRDIENGNIIVSLNIDIDNDLEIEGIARDILRAIQNKRKELDLDISDKINVNIFGNSKINETLESYNEYISTNSLAEKLVFDKNTKSEKIKISETNEIFLSINKS